MTLKHMGSTTDLLVLGDGVWKIEIHRTGCVDISIAGGRAHECDLQKVAALLLEARRIAGDWFGPSWGG